MGRAVTYTLVLTAASANNICLSQTPLAAGNLTLNGALVAAGVATTDAARRIRFTFAADDSARTFGVYGTNHDGNVIVENVTGTATTADTTLDFKTVTRISVDAATAGAVTVGTNGVGSTKWWQPNIHIDPFAVGFGVTVTGTVNYDVEHTFNDPRMPANMLAANNAVIPIVFDHATIAAQTANANSNYAFPCRGIRATLNSGTGTIVATFIQAGIRGN